MALESAGVSIISKIAGVLVEPVGRQFRYMFCLESFAQEFNERKQNLVSAKERLQKGVEAAERNAEEIYKDVKKWLEDATKAIDHEDVKHLENEIRKNDNRFTCCPNCIRQFKLSKALAKKSETFRKLGESSEKLKTVAQKAPPQPIEFLTSKEFTTSESSKEALEQIMKALKDDTVNMIGLYGMGGVGKTTLVKEVGRRAKESQLFPDVLMATVSQNPNFIGIQDRMADSLHLKFEKTSKEGRASELWQRLQGKKMLIILDDVWKHIDLEEIGIPFGDDHRGCKILLTTRVQGICFSMECQQKVLLKTIFIKECGKLEYVFPVSMSPSLPNLEQMTIYYADNLKQIFYSGEGDALTTDGIIKFPQLRELSLGLRSNYGFIGPRNFDFQLPSLQNLNIKGHEEVGNWLAQLQQNGFLQRLEAVHMRDCGDVRAPFPAKLLRAVKNLKKVGVWCCKSLEEVFELGEADEGSSEEKELLSSLTELLLSGLPELKCIWKGPTRHVSLQSLAYLYLNSLDKLTFILTPSLARSLPKLETLEISECGELKYIIREEDGEREIIPESPCFPRLKTIFIKDCGKLEYVFPVSVSPSLPNLELMTIDRTDNLKQIFYSGEGDALTTDGIIKFPRLSDLVLSSISNYSFFGPTNLAAQLPSLRFLKINGHKELGNLFAQLQGFTNLKELSLESVPDLRGLLLSKLTTLEMAAHGEQNGSLHRLERVRVDDCGDVRAPFPAKLLRALKNLSSVNINGCKSLEEVFELGEPDEGSREEKELPLLSSLTGLRLSGLPELKCMWKGPTRHVSLQSLAYLDLWSLDKLTFIFTPSLARSLPKLERLYIGKCGQLKHIIREEDGEKEIIPEPPGQDGQASPINVEKEIVLPNLKELSIQQLSSIVCFSFGWCDYLLFPRLEKLEVHLCPKLTTKFASTPDGSMSAQSEVSEVAEDSSIYREWTRDKGWKER